MTDPTRAKSHKASQSAGPPTAETLIVGALKGDEPPSNTVALVRWLVVILVTFGLLIAGFLWISRSLTDPGDVPATVEGGPAAPSYPTPDFRLASLSGETIGPHDFEGQAVVIDFWATWCGPCRIQAKMLEKLHEELGDKGVQFLAINVGEDLESVRSYVEETPFSYSVLLDPKEELSVKYEIYGLPTVMVVDRKGQISFLRTGLADIPTLRRELAKVGVDV